MEVPVFFHDDLYKKNSGKFIHPRYCNMSPEKIEEYNKKRINRNSPRPENWVYKNEIKRFVYFYETIRSDRKEVKNPRVVTICFKHNRLTGVTQYGASIWTKTKNDNNFVRITQMEYAKQRFEKSPIILKLNPTPKTNRDVQECLRWVIHKLGTSAESRNYKKWYSRNIPESKNMPESRKKTGWFGKLISGF